jgi:hypothetical protein
MSLALHIEKSFHSPSFQQRCSYNIMASAMSHRNSPERASTAFAEDLVFRETADRHWHQPVTDVFLAFLNLDGFFRKFCRLNHNQHGNRYIRCEHNHLHRSTGILLAVCAVAGKHIFWLALNGEFNAFAEACSFINRFAHRGRSLLIVMVLFD